MSLGIKALPTFQLYRGGKQVDTMTGAKVRQGERGSRKAGTREGDTGGGPGVAVKGTLKGGGGARTWGCVCVGAKASGARRGRAAAEGMVGRTQRWAWCLVVDATRSGVISGLLPTAPGPQQPAGRRGQEPSVGRGRGCDRKAAWERNGKRRGRWRAERR